MQKDIDFCYKISSSNTLKIMCQKQEKILCVFEKQFTLKPHKITF